ncbi:MULTISPECIES: type I phosphomannose isomerase catalytic subunit [unclassified Clostridium]|uniref:type I phosphomannose isomerase catalytic subunit n=1 Tax=unclassified Clostridium TaxID=2614128 RepID=UPI000298692B|nr:MULTISPECIES: type I phosphomannose isomerase catalytic subunit [unclassified Clostridium]EKQ55433.1 MAG: phosphomannose isomerase [Clostridium sp. Maddingley MBC34-26]
MLYPYKMKPVYKDYIWGGHNLKKMGKHMLESRVAESWELSAIPGSESEIVNGVLKGQKLTNVIEKYGSLVLGEKFTTIVSKNLLPVLLKLIDANKPLSVQVHPDDKYAIKNENGKIGKTEMWYIIDAKPSATVIHGFSEGFDKNKINDSILNHKHEGLYREVPVKKGDVVFVPAGTVHALKDGLVIAEVQQHSDLTYRLYDYDRIDSNGNKRPLHTNKALEVLNFKNNKPLYSGLSIRNDKLKSTYLAISEHFCVRLIEGIGTPVELMANGEFSALMFISGEGEIIWGNEKVPVAALETVLIPAYLGSYKIEGTFSALQVFIPESLPNLYASLRKEGFSNEQIINNIAGVENIYVPLKMAV